MNITLDDIVRNYMVSQGKNTLHGYVRIMKHLVDFLRNFSLDNTYIDNRVVLQMDEKKAIQFPDDLIAVKAVAWQSGDRILKFEVDNRINLNFSRVDDVGSSTPNEPYMTAQVWPYNGVGPIADYLMFSGQYTGQVVNQLGAGDNGLAYFRINWQDREIQFNANTPGTWDVYLEYKSNGFNPKSKSSIPEFAAKVAEEYVHWQLGRHKFGDASAEAEARRRRYKQEYDDMIARLDPLDYEAIVGARARSFDINKILH